MNFLRTDVICMRNVLKYHSAKDPGKVDSPFEVRFDMNASRKRKNTKPKGFFEKLKEQRNQRKADRARQGVGLLHYCLSFYRRQFVFI